MRRRLLVLLALLALVASCNPTAPSQTAGLTVAGGAGPAADAGGDAEDAAAVAAPVPPDGPEVVRLPASADAFARVGAAGRAAAPRATPEPALPPVETLLPEIRLDVAEGGFLHTDAVAAAMGTPGVAFATALSIGRVPLTLPDGRSGELTMAGIDPAGFRVLVPQITADEPAVWERLAEGHLAVTHALAEDLGLALEDVVVVPDGELRLKVIAALGQPPVAHAVVDLVEGQRLGLAAPTSLLVAVDADAWPDEVAAALERALGMEATLIYGKPQRRLQGLPSGTVWDALAMCEASGDWRADTGNGYYGGLQFLPSSWQLVGGVGLPHEASRDEQIHRAELLLQRQGWRAWPVCSVRLGLREPGPDEHPDGRPKRPPTSPAPAGGPTAEEG